MGAAASSVGALPTAERLAKTEEERQLAANTKSPTILISFLGCFVPNATTPIDEVHARSDAPIREAVSWIGTDAPSWFHASRAAQGIAGAEGLLVSKSEIESLLKANVPSTSSQTLRLLRDASCDLLYKIECVVGGNKPGGDGAPAVVVDLLPQHAPSGSACALLSSALLTPVEIEGGGRDEGVSPDDFADMLALGLRDVLRAAKLQGRTLHLAPGDVFEFKLASAGSARRVLVTACDPAAGGFVTVETDFSFDVHSEIRCAYRAKFLPLPPSRFPGAPPAAASAPTVVSHESRLRLRHTLRWLAGRKGLRVNNLVMVGFDRALWLCDRADRSRSAEMEEEYDDVVDATADPRSERSRQRQRDVFSRDAWFILSPQALVAISEYPRCEPVSCARCLTLCSPPSERYRDLTFACAQCGFAIPNPQSPVWISVESLRPGPGRRLMICIREALGTMRASDPRAMVLSAMLPRFPTLPETGMLDPDELDAIALRIDPLAFDADVATPEPPRGLSSEALARLPVWSFNSKVAGASSARCEICLEAYAENTQIMCLPCLHRFHVHCATGWLSLSSTCPLCKTSVLNADESKGQSAPSSNGCTASGE